MPVTFRNPFGEDRVCPTLGFGLVPDGDTITVPDDQAHHWDAAGWTRVDTTTPAAAPAKTASTTPGPAEGTDQ